MQNSNNKICMLIIFNEENIQRYVLSNLYKRKNFSFNLINSYPLFLKYE